MKLVGQTGSRLVRRREWTTQAWKNGAGITHEVLRWSLTPPAADEYDVRLSVAEVEGAQPFSAFPGYHRSLICLETSSLLLGSAPMVKLQAFHFPGDVPMATHGTGRATDFNVISRQARPARVEVSVEESDGSPVHRARPLAVFALEATVLRSEGVERVLEPFDTWVELEGGVAYQASAPVVWIRF